MKEKVQWYEEILASDPTSKIFFPLAQLYIQDGHKDKAIQTLRDGLNKHPEHLEAKLLLSQILGQGGNEVEIQRLLFSVISLLKKYPEIWDYWSRMEEEGHNLDLSLALRFVFLSTSEDSLSWAEILNLGFQGLKKKDLTDLGELNQWGMENETSSENNEFRADKTALGEDEPDLNMQPYKTRTMADILAGQGDYAQAISIYSELLENDPSQMEKERLEARIKELKNCLEETAGSFDSGLSLEDEDGSKYLDQNLVHKLERLASRLEKKGE